MNGLGSRAVLVPDLGEELAVAIEALGALFEALGAAERGGAVLPEPLAGGTALAALRRLWGAVAPTQGRHGSAACPAGRLYAPGGRVEHVPVRLVDVDPIDVATLSAAAAALGRGASGAGPVRAALTDCRADRPGVDLVAVAAGFSGLLDLADTGESIVLRERLAAAGPGVDVVLTPVQENAYQATAERLNAMLPVR
ncbi:MULTISPECIES: hypothetical protein [unclassified Nonomuraea]|uniref:hypothetical protein n=1 Tax=unclassified Nonomuraea TaxID=2593643 RepID=UPI0033DDAE14